MEELNMRNQLIEQATLAFTRGLIDQDDFETIMTRINQLDTQQELTSLATSLPVIFPSGWGQSSMLTQSELDQFQELRVNSGNIKKQGLWIDSPAYLIVLHSSNMSLDLRAYEDTTNLQLILNLELSRSNLKIILPETWQVGDRIEDKVSSNVKIRSPSINWGSNRIILSGSLHSSNLKVKYR